MNKIIVFEGSDGVGKTTHLRYLCDFLTERGIPHIATQEFSGDPIRRSFREMFMYDLNPLEELSVINLARSWHMRNVITKSLEEGKIVLMDRFIESTWAYQGGGRQIRSEIIQFMQDNIWKVPKPDLTIFLDGICMRNVRQDRFEHESEDFFLRVKKMYEARMDASWTCFDNINRDITKKNIQSHVINFLQLD